VDKATTDGEISTAGDALTQAEQPDTLTTLKTVLKGSPGDANELTDGQVEDVIDQLKEKSAITVSDSGAVGYLPADSTTSIPEHLTSLVKEMNKISLSSMSESGVKLNIANAVLALTQTATKQLGDAIKGVSQKM
jgi:hypothetical protein